MPAEAQALSYFFFCLFSFFKPTFSKTFHHGILQKYKAGTSLAVQWLGLWASTAGGMGSIPGQGTKFPQAARQGQI